MGFSDAQLRALARRVPARRIRTRICEGKELAYIEGWFALDQANRIFGFDGWDRQTLEARCIQSRDMVGSTSAVYSAHVRISVRTESATVFRDGHGTGEAKANSPGEAHDHALKAAETDATKRALATFGKAFGLALYGTQQARARAAARPLPEQQGQTNRTSADPNRSSSDLQGIRQPEPKVPLELAPAPKPHGATPRRGTIDKSALTFSEPRRIRDKDHLRFVAAQPCVLCGKTPSDAHHLRFAQLRAMSRKVSDEFTVPLCRAHHRELHHEGNEVAWWHDMGIDPLAIARDLWADDHRRQTPVQAAAGTAVEAK